MSEPLILRARAAAPIEAVRRALSDPDQLRAWFAEFAEVDLPRTYVFWGRYTPEGEVPQQQLLFSDDSTVRFSWCLDGIDTTTGNWRRSRNSSLHAYHCLADGVRVRGTAGGAHQPRLAPDVLGAVAG